MTWLTTREVSEYLRLSERTVYKLARDNQLPVTKVGGVYRFDKEGLDQWLTARSSPRIGDKDLATQKDMSDVAILSRIKKEPDVLKKKLLFMGLLNKKLEQQPSKPVVVGGTALEFYTAGGYATIDIDIVYPSEPLEAILARLGLTKKGRYWFSDDLGIVLEAPSSFLEAGARKRVVEVKVGAFSVTLLGIEDLVIDRMNAFVHWRSDDDGNWAKELLAIHGQDLDRGYLLKAAKKNKVDEELNLFLLELGMEEVL